MFRDINCIRNCDHNTTLAQVIHTLDIIYIVIKDNICGKKFFDFSIIDTIIQKNPYIQRISCRLTEQYTREVVEVMDHLRDNCLHLRQINCHFLKLDNNYKLHLFNCISSETFILNELYLR